MANEDTVTLENVEIIFRNFAGREQQYNPRGARNFAVLLTPEMAEGLLADGWNVKTTKEREVDDEMVGGEPYLPVKVHYGGRKPPLVVIITSRGRTNLGEGEVELLDFADIRNVDLIIRPFDWDISGKSGRKAYLKSIFITINEDELELKYADVQIAGTRHIEEAGDE